MILQRFLNYIKTIEDVKEKCKIVPIEDIKESLMPKLYIDSEPMIKLDTNEINKEYINSYKKLKKHEEVMNKLLLEGGYLNE